MNKYTEELAAWYQFYKAHNRDNQAAEVKYELLDLLEDKWKVSSLLNKAGVVIPRP